MICENEYCIYNKGGNCLFERVTINTLGMCDDCTIVSLDKEFLEAEKEQQLKKIDSRWEAMGK